MAGGDVTDLVRQNGSELIFAVQVSQHAARDIDISARKSHGVDDRTVEHGESDRSIAYLLVGAGPPEVARCEHAIADVHDVALHFRIAVEAEECRDFLADLLADLHFLLPGITEIASLPSGGHEIGDA